jgi:uncharacterized repeat protein (TIGR02543 family)
MTAATTMNSRRLRYEHTEKGEMFMKKKKLIAAIGAATLIFLISVITIIAEELPPPLASISSSSDATLLLTTDGDFILNDNTALANPLTIGGGSISMDKATHTLTMNNVNLTTTADVAFIINYVDSVNNTALTVELNGENSFTSTKDDTSYGLTINSPSEFVFEQGSALKLSGNSSASPTAISYAADLLYREKTAADSDWTYSLDTENSGIINTSAKIIEIYSDFYGVTFEANGGTAVSPHYKVGNETLTLPAAPTRDGYTFNGWYSDNGTFELHVTSLDSISEDTTLYAMWEYTGLYTETLYIDGAGDLYMGGMQLPNSAEVGGGTIGYSANTLTMSNINFTTSASTALKIEPDVTIVISGDNSITSTYDLGNSIAVEQMTGTLNITGSGTIRLLGDTYAANTNMTFGPSVLYREKFTADSEWAYFIDDSAPQSKGAGTLAAEITTDYAVVTLNPNDDELVSGQPLTTLYRFEEDIPVLPAPTAEGLYFIGWFNGDTQATALDTLSGNITLDARWSDVPPSPFPSETGETDSGNEGNAGNAENEENPAAAAEDPLIPGVISALTPIENPDGSLSVTSFSGITATIYPSVSGVTVKAGVNLTSSVNSQSTAAAVLEAVKIAQGKSAFYVTVVIPDEAVGLSIHTVKKLLVAAGAMELILECPTLENGLQVGNIRLTINEGTGQILTGISFDTGRVRECEDYVTRLIGAEVVGGFETAQKGGFGGPATVSVSLEKIGIKAVDGIEFYVMIYDSKTGKWYEDTAIVEGGNAVIDTERSGIFLVLMNRPY